MKRMILPNGVCCAQRFFFGGGVNMNQRRTARSSVASTQGTNQCYEADTNFTQRGCGPPDEVTKRSIRCCRLHYLHSRPKLWLSRFFSFWTLLSAPPFFSLIVTPADRRHRLTAIPLARTLFRFLRSKLPQ